MAVSDGVRTSRLHFQEQDVKDQRKTETLTLRVTVPFGKVSTENHNLLGFFSARPNRELHRIKKTTNL